MNLSGLGMLLTALFFFTAGCSAGLIWAGARRWRTKARPVPSCLADPATSAELDACRDLLDQFDQALCRHLNDVADGGHDDGALVLLSVLDRAGIGRDQLDDLIDTLAWLAVYDDLHGDDSPEQSRRERGLARLASRRSRRAMQQHEPGASVTE